MALYEFHSQATIALEESGISETFWVPAVEVENASKCSESLAKDNLAALSMSASLLSLNSVLLGKNPCWRDLASRRDRSARTSHPSICAAKRLFDFVFALCALITFSPVLAACAIALRLESAGPLLFRQHRLGKDGRTFKILKFRTMVPEAESVLAAYLAVDPVAKAEWKADRKLRKDPRVTRMGSLMRRLSLDELPQFWNVLKGDMSIVGPRPIVDAEVRYYGIDFARYSAVRPGITGLWQVSGRNDVSYPNRVALDCSYVRGWSAALDLRIIGKTVTTVLRAAGAY